MSNVHDRIDVSDINVNALLLLLLLQVRMMEERLVKGEYCLSTSGVGSPPHSLPSTSGTQNDKPDDVHCACISKLETQVEEQVNTAVPRASGNGINLFFSFAIFRSRIRGGGEEGKGPPGLLVGGKYKIRSTAINYR